MREASRQLAEGEFSWERTAELTEALYLRLLAGPTT
jgi:glycosyltransferase involved in cell wall biosynthesis